MVRTRFIGAFLISLLGSLGRLESAAAQDSQHPKVTTTPAREGAVLALESGELTVDLASAVGARVGDIVEIWRPVELRHPVTNRLVTDRFRLGSLRLTQVQTALSLAVPDGALTRPPRVGDIVRFTPSAAIQTEAPSRVAASPSLAPAANVGTAVPAAGPEAAAKADAAAALAAPALAAPADVDAAEVSALFESLRGTPPEVRAARYATFANAHKTSRFVPVLREEASQLLLLTRMVAEASRSSAPVLVSSLPPDRVVRGKPVSVVVQLSGATGALIHIRDVDQNDAASPYQSHPMLPMETGHFAFSIGVVPNKMQLEYFVEGVSTAGQAASVVGTANRPVRVPIVSEDAAAEFPHHVQLRLHTDYADWNRLQGNDTAWQTEGELGLRLRDVGLRAARMGFGVFRGKGGSIEELDQLALQPRRVGLTYGYLEGEFGTSRTFGILARLIAGLNDGGVAAGAQGFLRFGSDRETNLLLGGEALGGVGVRGITEIQLRTIPKVLLIFRTEVTNQPAGAASEPTPSTVPAASTDPLAPPPLPDPNAHALSEVGARAIAEIGYELWPNFIPSVRASYQGRTITHAGPGIGGGVTYQW